MQKTDRPTDRQEKAIVRRLVGSRICRRYRLTRPTGRQVQSQTGRCNHHRQAGAITGRQIQQLVRQMQSPDLHAYTAVSHTDRQIDTAVSRIGRQVDKVVRHIN